MRVQLLGRDQLKKALTDLVKQTQAAVVSEVGRATRGTRGEAKQLCPTAFGTLQKSIRHRFTDGGKKGEVYVAKKYGEWVEGIYHRGLMGRAPGRWPPVKPILRWVVKMELPEEWNMSKESATFLVRRKIGKKGTPAQPFLGPAFFHYAEMFQAACKRIIARSAKTANWLMKEAGA